MYVTCVRCPSRPEEVVRSPVSGVTGGGNPLSMSAGAQTQEVQFMLLTIGLSLQPPRQYIFKNNYFIFLNYFSSFYFM